jgi:hypothetical protein
MSLASDDPEHVIPAGFNFDPLRPALHAMAGLVAVIDALV